MKKRLFVYFGIGLIFILTIMTVLLFVNKKEKKFYLENHYYTSSDVKEIKMDDLSDLINKKESFAVFVYQPMCVTSSDFESVLSDFLKSNKISIYKIAFSDIKNTDIGKSIKYYPSFIIYNKGKIVDFLEADKDEDVARYTSKDDFEKWFTKYVKLRTSSFDDAKSFDDGVTKEENNTSIEANLENVVKEDNKVNIYFFWGNGCPHCEDEIQFFEDIKKKYVNYYNLYTFETWYNEENAKLLYAFAKGMDDDVTKVPYTIIEDKSFVGFSEKYKSEFIREIEKQHNNIYDVYFDKIKK